VSTWNLCLKLPTFWDPDVRDRFGDLAKSIRECPPAGSKAGGLGVEQMLRQRCDTVQQGAPFLA
jgi:hypothetical protein